MEIETAPVPHLTTASCKPLQSLERLLLEKQIDIETWFRQQWQKTPAPITSSVDIRNAGFKLAAVDTNLFPAGFNNLNPEFYPLSIQAAQSVLQGSMPGCKKILLIPENHTRNPFYLESLATLYDIFFNAGFEVRIGSLREDITEKTTITADSGKTLEFFPVHRENNRVKALDFDPCLILLNNDLSDGIPPILENIDQWVRPTEKLGWTKRQKTNHFSIYRGVCEEFAELIDIDPWFLNPLYRSATHVNLSKREGEQAVAEQIDQLIGDIKEKYQTYQINQTPFVFVKADAGTYGMGIVMVKSGEELCQMNRKQRNKMAKTKGQQTIDKVIIQEGVPTFESWQTDDAVAEPVVYMIGHFVVGGFYRVHKDRGKEENLNAPGMHFEPLAFAKPCNYPGQHQSRFYAYGVIARLAALSAAREIAKANAL